MLHDFGIALPLSYCAGSKSKKSLPSFPGKWLCNVSPSDTFGDVLFRNAAFDPEPFWRSCADMFPPINCRHLIPNAMGITYPILSIYRPSTFQTFNPVDAMVKSSRSKTINPFRFGSISVNGLVEISQLDDKLVYRNCIRAIVKNTQSHCHQKVADMTGTVSGKMCVLNSKHPKD